MTRQPRPPHPFVLLLAGRRDTLGLTYLEVAKAAGVAESSVYRALNGQSDPSFMTVAGIAAAMDVPLLPGAAATDAQTPPGDTYAEDRSQS